MTKFKDLKVNECLSEVQYYRVVKIAGEKIQLVNDWNENIVVDKSYVEKCLTSAEQFDKTETLNKTDAASLLLKNPNVVMTVNFNKQVKEADVKKQIHELYPNKGGKILSEADFKKNVNTILKSALEGEGRNMIGFHRSHINDLGRLEFIDLEVEKDSTKSYENRVRFIDTRTLNFLILRGVKYLIK